MFVETPGSTIGSVGKSVQSPFGPVQRWTTWPPAPGVHTATAVTAAAVCRWGLDPRATERGRN